MQMTPLRLALSVLGVFSAVRGVAAAQREVQLRSGISLHYGLAARADDDPGVPASCKVTCDPVNDLLETGSCAPNTCCTTLFQSAYFNCLTCVGKADNATKAQFALAQTDLDNFTIACSQLGFALPKLTLPGQNPNRTLATASSLSQHSTAPSQQTVTSLPTLTSQNPFTQQTFTPTDSDTGAEASSTGGAGATGGGTGGAAPTNIGSARGLQLDVISAGLLIVGTLVGGMML